MRTVYFVAGFRSPTCNKKSTTQCKVKCLTITVNKKMHEPSYELLQYTKNIRTRTVINPLVHQTLQGFGLKAEEGPSGLAKCIEI